MDNYLIGIVIFVVAIFGSRMIQDKASKNLSPEKKLELFDVFGKNRWPGYLFLVLIIVGYMILLKADIIPFLYSYILFMALMAVFLAFSMYSNYSKLKKHDYPSNYIKTYLIAAAIRIAGMAIFVGITFTNF